MDINTFNFISTTSVSPLSTILKRHSICVFYLLKSFQLKSCLLWIYFNPNNLLMRPKKVVLICKNERNNLTNWHCKVIGQNHNISKFQTLINQLRKLVPLVSLAKDIHVQCHSPTSTLFVPPPFHCCLIASLLPLTLS